jgi:hypothetical protein
MNELLASWGLWCRVGLGRPRVTSVKFGDGAVGDDFNEQDMKRLDGLIASLGKPTAKFVENVYRFEWPVKVSACKAGFKLEKTAAGELLSGVIKKLEIAWAQKG